ncbi:hypothetical protein [Virgibacillus dokdonensis]|uniref:hypothetical protein n=1 Tax=Virgibacillus dokdonensis TaxID=302167 RepID=UPI0020CA2383|nr:hypothetical protein [Virgibacillus dokdonensis]
MRILELNNYSLTKSFLENLIPHEVEMFDYSGLHIITRTRYCPQEHKEYEYIIGISPYQKAINNHNEYEDNSGSIPDAWICGGNFNLLFEFKIRGVLDEAQISAHKRLLKNCKKVIRLRWIDIINSLKEVNKNADSTERFLVEQFLLVTNNFKSKRKSSGMPKQIISHINKDKEPHFVITGSQKVKPYIVEYVCDGKKTIINNNLSGIQEARRWIAKYINQNKETLPIPNDGMNTVISDYCVAPGRAEKKNQWNQWRLGAFL